MTGKEEVVESARPIGFAAMRKRKLREISRKGGRMALGRYVFTRRKAREASLSRTDHEPLKSRKHEGRYEYYVEGVGWVTRQRVYQLRKQGKL